jgi:hypothetical protein
MTQASNQPKDQLYSETEVKNPGYPGALLILSAPLLIFGGVGIVRAALQGDWIGVALWAMVWAWPGVALVVKSVRARRAQRQ